MKIMISQPMNGKTEEQIKAEREKVIKYFEEQGHEVINTIFSEKPPKDVDTAIFYLAKSIEAIGMVDAVVFMPNWNNARGCIIEHQVATAYNKFIKYI